MIIHWKGIPIIDEMRNVPSHKGMNTTKHQTFDFIPHIHGSSLVGIRPGYFLLNCGEKVQVHMQYPWLHPFLVWSIMICGGFKEVLVQYYGNKPAPGPKFVRSIYIYINIYILY